MGNKQGKYGQQGSMSLQATKQLARQRFEQRTFGGFVTDFAKQFYPFVHAISALLYRATLPPPQASSMF
ncbi:MAG: hypothetical protein KF897_17350 [Opitutaceae bacterium]|nr:hypothetical protein [Opitutaceae bacterium]